MPKGYIIAQIKVTDPDTYPKYVALVLPTIEKFGGQFLVRGGRAESFESTPLGDRNVVIEFPSYDNAYNWYHSTEYADAKKLRMSASISIQTIAEGI